VDDYQLFTTLAPGVHTDCPHDEEQGELVSHAALDFGNILGGERAKPFLDEADHIGRAGELPGAMAPLMLGASLGAERTLILPPHCFTQLVKAPPSYPLHGVALVSAIELRKVFTELTVLDAAAHFLKLVEFCIRTRMVLSTRATPRDHA